MDSSPASPGRKQLSHDRIVDAAARAIRARGYDGVGVAEVMREAGLTHGGFYAHFDSRDALLVAALDRAGRVSGEAIARRIAAAGPDVSPFRVLVESYLSDGLLKAPEAGCPVAALCSEMPRQGGAVRKASSQRVRALVRAVEKTLPAAVPVEHAAVIAATLVGSLQMARALDGAAGRTLLATTRATLLAQYEPR